MSMQSHAQQPRQAQHATGEQPRGSAAAAAAPVRSDATRCDVLRRWDTLSLYDAHCHWHDPRLRPHADEIAATLAGCGLRRAVVNATSPADWQQVAALAKSDPRVLPAFGLHPWHVNAVLGGQLTPDELQSALAALLDAFPEAAIGEIGLDNWIDDADKPLQREAFLLQLALAAQGNRAVSIHCLRAEADLLAALRSADALPARGIHLHGFAGSWQSAKQLLDLGAYFSFSEYIAQPRRIKAREIAQKIPVERLLAETDAPDMQGPEHWQYYRLPEKETPENNPVTDAHAAPTNQLAQQTQLPPKHPANIVAAYACLAELRGAAPEVLAAQIETNFLCYFGH